MRNPCRIRDITDGTSNTIIAIDAGDEHAVEWTKPDDWQFDPEPGIESIFRSHAPGGIDAMFADGSVRVSQANDRAGDAASALVAERRRSDQSGGPVTRNRAISSVVQVAFVLETFQVVEHLVERVDRLPGDAAGLVELAKRRGLRRTLIHRSGVRAGPRWVGHDWSSFLPCRESTGRGGAQVVLMLDQPECALGDGASKRFDSGGDVVLGIDGQADVVQQGRQQEFLVVGANVSRQVKDLQAVKEGVALGVLFGVLLDLFQRLEPHLVDGETVEGCGEGADLFTRLGLGL